MRLLFSNATRDWGGEKSWALETASCLAARGHACAMIARTGDRWAEACRAAALETHEVRFGAGIFNPLGLVGVARVARGFRPDCILVNLSRDMCAGAVAGTWLGVPVVRHVGLAEDLNHDPIDWFLHRRIFASVIAVGHQMKEEMVAAHRYVHPEQVEVIHIGKDTRVFRPGQADGLRREWGLAPDALVLGVTSQLEAKKGHTVLFEAIAKLGDPRLHVAVVGRGGHRDALASRVAALGLDDRVRFLGFRRDLPELLRVFDLFALPSLNEGFPNTLVEAMASGLACVATDLACVSEILRHEENGLLAAPGDADGLASALGRLTGDLALRNRLGAAARASVEAAFGLEATTSRLEQHLTDVIAAQRPVPA